MSGPGYRISRQHDVKVAAEARAISAGISFAEALAQILGESTAEGASLGASVASNVPGRHLNEGISLGASESWDSPQRSLSETLSPGDAVTAATSGSNEPIYASGTDTSLFFDNLSYANVSAFLSAGYAKNSSVNDSNTYRVTGYDGYAVHFAFAGTFQEESLLYEWSSFGSSLNNVSPLILTYVWRWMTGFIWTQPGTSGDGWYGNTRKTFYQYGPSLIGAISMGHEGAAPACASPPGDGDYYAPSLSSTAWPQNQNRGSGAGQMTITSSGSQTTRAQNVIINGNVAGGHWIRTTWRMTASPDSGSHGRMEGWMTDLSQGVTVQICDWNGNSLSDPCFGAVNVPQVSSSTPLVNRFQFPANSNCRPGQAQWLEYDSIRYWKQGS